MVVMVVNGNVLGKNTVVFQLQSSLGEKREKGIWNKCPTSGQRKKNVKSINSLTTDQYTTVYTNAGV